MNMELEIQEIIKKNLPQHLGDILKTRLEQADKDAEKIIKLNSEIDILQKEILDKNLIIENYKKNDSFYLQINEREQHLNKLQYDLELTILKEKLNSAESKSEFAKSVALGLVRNIEFRKTVFDSENQMPYYSGSTYIQPSPINKNLTECQVNE